jgi:hypothetical protein
VSRKSRERINAGVQRPRHGQKPAGAPNRNLKLPGSRDAVLFRKLAGCQDWEREGIREYLRRDGSKKALATLAELEREWGTPVPPEGEEP